MKFVVLVSIYPESIMKTFFTEIFQTQSQNRLKPCQHSILKDTVLSSFGLHTNFVFRI